MNVLRKKTLWYVGIIFAAFIILWPLLRKGFYISDDGEWMVIRLSAFYQSLAEGQFPVRFLGRLNNSYGYPVANFLYPGFLYIGSIFHFIGFSFVDSIKLILGFSTLGSAFFLFAWLSYNVSTLGAFVGSISYLFAPYLVYDLYTRGSVGEILALLAVSVALYSIDAKKRWLFPLSIGLLIVSHNSLALIFFIFLLLYILILHYRGFLLPMILGIGLASFFWIPALVEKSFVRFDSLNISNPADYFISKESFWLLGLPFFIALYLLLSSRKKKSTRLVYMLILYIVSTWLATTLSKPLWSTHILSSLFQFPFRMLSVSLVTGSFLVASAIDVSTKKRLLLSIILISLGFFIVFPRVMNISFINRPEGYYTTNEATTTVTSEYMPRWVHEIPNERTPSKVIVHKGNAKVISAVMSTQKIDVFLDAKEESVIQLNTIYYPGWGITVDNISQEISYQNPQGIMRVTVPTGTHRLIAEFRENIPRFLADVVSAISIIGYGIYLVKINRNHV